MKQKNVMRGLAGLSATLLAVSSAATAVASTRTDFINSKLGTSSFKLVEKGDGTGDSIYFDSEFSSVQDLIDAKKQLAEEISEEGSVLFKNTNEALPLDKTSEKVTLWGMNSHVPTLGGEIGSSVAGPEDAVFYGLEEAFAEKEFNVNQDMIDFYSSDTVAKYMRMGGFGQPGHSLTPGFGPMYEENKDYPIGEIPASEYSDELLKSADDTVAVVVISRDSSEAADYEPDMVNTTSGDSFERPLALSDYERQMIALAKEHSTKVIVLINSDNPIEIEELKEDEEIDSILWTGLPGMYGFLGVADVLSGEANPSGHISDTYAVNSTSAPSMVNFGIYTYSNSSTSGEKDSLTEVNKGDWFEVESEGIYNGYKYYETRYEDCVLGRGNAGTTEGSSTGEAWDYAAEVSYPFGYGLSYTTFEQKLESVEVQPGTAGKATVTVTNTGDVAGKDVAQLYVQAPYTEGGIEKSAIQLVGIAKTQLLGPGESETVEIEINPAYFASYDENAVKADETTGAWVLDEGDYYFALGNGAHEALNNVLAKKNGSEDGLVSVNEDAVVNPENVQVWNLAAKDMETYSANVQNALQDCDINNLIENTVEYTTRTDWSKGWTAVESITPTEAMMEGLRNSRTELTENGEGTTWGKENGLKLIDMMITDENGNYSGVIDINDPMWDQLIEQMSLDEAIQFIEYGGDDIENIDSVFLPRTYEQDGPIGFSYDQVAGYSARWSKDLSDEPTYVGEDDKNADTSMATFPTEVVVAATFNTNLLEREGELLGEDGLWSNISVINAPGLNLHRAVYCARNFEYYSEDSMLTNILGKAVCQGAQSKGLMAAVKHFAYNHQETNRSGMSVFFTEQAARENELRGFQGAMAENIAGGAMTAFNRVGVDYSGASRNLLEQITRNEWGYTGAYVTDMINGADYMNWRDIVFNGGGIALTSAAYADSEIGLMEDVKADIAKDTSFQEALKLNIKYWLYNLVKTNAMNGITNTSVMESVIPWWQMAFYGVDAFLALLTLLFIVLYAKKLKKA